jgi:hypothetical protein
MPKYLIERELPGAGMLPDEKLAAIASRARGVLRDLGPDIQWVHSYVTDDKLYCVYIARDEEIILEHARRGGFPADSIMHVGGMIDLTTAE